LPALTDNIVTTVQLADRSSLQSATLGLHPVAVAIMIGKLLLIFRPIGKIAIFDQHFALSCK